MASWRVSVAWIIPIYHITGIICLCNSWQRRAWRSGYWSSQWRESSAKIQLESWQNMRNVECWLWHRRAGSTSCNRRKWQWREEINMAKRIISIMKRHHIKENESMKIEKMWKYLEINCISKKYSCALACSLGSWNILSLTSVATYAWHSTEAACRNAWPLSYNILAGLKTEAWPQMASLAWPGLVAEKQETHPKTFSASALSCVRSYNPNTRLLARIC